MQPICGNENCQYKLMIPYPYENDLAGRWWQTFSGFGGEYDESVRVASTNLGPVFCSSFRLAEIPEY